ncbi:MAG TPA: nuclear transport factor 2 family protein [Acidobacteriota bacterium]|nr:nuclear transport factor 2 family protein [Acidobacteriota bacterium]HND19144.1 nuclear transport factor 2 family protein [Acidobacteriota bacterium]HNG91910.1 nuclear transport factor 2 family protein [Acidobacteriota bacterium]HNJ39079.1 nuclear transport factor 2 family protein [Acidobacteriota bacterium]
MFRAVLMVLILVGTGVAGFAQNKSRLDREIEALLQVHKKDRQAHFETDARKLMEHAADDFIAVSNGTIQRSTRAEVLKTFEAYFQNAKYFEWDDLEPPIVRVSNDASLAWMIVRTRVRRTQKQADGSDKERSFVYAGIMTYEKKKGKWVRVANVSTFE